MGAPSHRHSQQPKPPQPGLAAACAPSTKIARKTKILAKNEPRERSSAGDVRGDVRPAASDPRDRLDGIIQVTLGRLSAEGSRCPADPSSRVYRGSRVAARINELGPHFMEGARGEGDSVAGHRARHAGGMIKRNDEGAIRPNMEPELGEFWNEADPHPPLNRGPKKVPEPVGRSGRQGMFGLLAHDPEVKSDYGRHGVDGTRARGNVHVKMPGSDTQIGKGSLLLYSNEYCLKNGLGGGGRMIDDDDDY